MDKDVLIRFVQFLETIFGRVNSKRLMVLYGLLLFLLYSKQMTREAVLLGTMASLLTLWAFQRDGKKSDIMPTSEKKADTVAQP
jgi:hypothetical protein